MYALTVQEPWASAIAWRGKDVENRGRRLPGKILGQVIAIHAGKGLDCLREFRSVYCGRPDAVMPAHLRPLRDLACQDHWNGLRTFGHIIATAQVVGVDWHPVSLVQPNVWAVPGCFGYRLANVCRVFDYEDYPTLRGALGVWVVPDDVAFRLQSLRDLPRVAEASPEDRALLNATESLRRFKT